LDRSVALNILDFPLTVINVSLRHWQEITRANISEIKI
jgi:hypothetical protein